ncbi:MAG: 4-hydroxy-tetrahydrodipicolinate synthase [Clostridia bacterium]|nr:4-hydroxy-tetrahydrodipicolinate synthase [Clostridia bacterium]
MKTPIFKGSAAALVTPFDRQGELDEPALLALIDWQLRCGTDALVVCATTGECATLSDREWSRVVSLAVERAAGRVPVIAGTGRNDTIHALRLGQEAKALGADAVLTVTPYYNKTTQQGLLRHYLFLAEGVELPMLLYNVPSRTGMSFRAETYAALAEHPNIYGVKEASGDFGLILRTRALCPENFALYSGNDDQIVPILALGGLGVISTAANVVPAELHALCDSFFRGDLPEARAIQLRLQPLIQALFLEVNPIPVKAALAAMGRMEETVRMPLTTLGPAARRALEQAMGRLSLL